MATTSDETIDVKYFSFEEIPPLSMNRTNKNHLEEIQLHLKDSNRQTYFD